MLTLRSSLTSLLALSLLAIGCGGRPAAAPRSPSPAPSEIAMSAPSSPAPTEDVEFVFVDRGDRGDASAASLPEPKAAPRPHMTTRDESTRGRLFTLPEKRTE
jgi:hypothetical protein